MLCVCIRAVAIIFVQVREERRRRMEAEKHLKNPTPASPTAEELEAAEAMWQESQPVRKFDPDRTDALYQDAQRRRESQASSNHARTCAHKTKNISLPSRPAGFLPTCWLFSIAYQTH